MKSFLIKVNKQWDTSQNRERAWQKEEIFLSCLHFSSCEFHIAPYLLGKCETPKVKSIITSGNVRIT